jgi:hypothetical protein
VVVLAIGVPAVAKLLSEDSQRVIAPVWPLNVKMIVEPVQTELLPEMVPPTDAELTVTVAIALFAELHGLLVSTAL